jgi:hypothetical protein
MANVDVDQGDLQLALEALYHQYDGANTRRFQNFSFHWQAVGLGVAAQAFLFAVMLQPTTAPVARYIAGSLAIVAALASWRLMHSQERFQKVEGDWLDHMEGLTLADVAQAVRGDTHGACTSCSCRRRGSAPRSPRVFPFALVHAGQYWKREANLPPARHPTCAPCRRGADTSDRPATRAGAMERLNRAARAGRAFRLLHLAFILAATTIIVITAVQPGLLR